jgi:transposase-like protein
MGVAELRRLKQLEEENRMLKQLVADLTLDKHMLQAMLNAIELKFPNTPRQRCIKHKIDNILSHVPDKQRKTVQQELRAIFYQKNRVQADQVAAVFIEKYRTDLAYPSQLERRQFLVKAADAHANLPSTGSSLRSRLAT